MPKSQPGPQSTKDKLSKIISNIKAPEDAAKCVEVETLNDYKKKAVKIIKNPRDTYFELSRNYYKAKYPDGDNKKEIHVKSFLETTDLKNYLKNLSMDIVQTQQGNIPVVKTYEYNAYDAANFVKAIKFYDYRNTGK